MRARPTATTRQWFTIRAFLYSGAAMATFVTHGLVGAALAPLMPKTTIPRYVLATVLVVLSVLPDLDVFAGRWLDIAYAHPLGHRGFSHSLAFAALAGAVTATLFVRYVRLLSRAWCGLAFFFFVATALHGVLDAFTDGGLGIGFFIPFDNSRYFFPWRPIEVSPLSLNGFLGKAGRVFLSEMIWVWIPLACAAGIYVRRTR